jgi:hypothetical protein
MNDSGARFTPPPDVVASRRDGLVDREVFDRRLGKLEQLLRQLRRAAKNDWETYRSDETLQVRWNVGFNSYPSAPSTSAIT